MLGKSAVINHTLDRKKMELHPKAFFTKRRRVDGKYLKTCIKFVLFILSRNMMLNKISLEITLKKN